jgi:hypothetical protein
MKRPSEVPPVVLSCGTDAELGLDGRHQRLVQRAGFGEEGLAAQHPASSCSTPWRASTSSNALLQRLGVLSVLKRKLKSTTSSPGITLPTPVPAWMLLTCQLVGRK